MNHRLCGLDDIEEHGSAGFTAEVNGEMQRLMVIRFDGQVYVYINECPHIHSPLDFNPGQFLNYDKNMIMCATHGALFNIDDGVCVHGPCLGKHLKPVKCRVHDESVWID